MREIPLNSSALRKCLYDPEHQFLWIRFRTGEHYVYERIPAAVVQALLEAPSHGQYFNSVIRSNFSFKRLS